MNNNVELQIAVETLKVEKESLEKKLSDLRYKLLMWELMLEKDGINSKKKVRKEIKEALEEIG